MGLLENNYRIEAPYMTPVEGVPNLGEISIQGTRHPDSLKLWLSLKKVGEEGYSFLWDHQFELTKKFVSEILKRPYLELACEPELPVICFRVKPRLADNVDSDAWNKSIQEYLLTKHHICLSLPLFQNQRWLRAVLINPFILEETILDLFNAIDRWYKSILPA